MPLRLLAVTFDAQDPARLGEFWAGILGRDVTEHAGGLLLPADGLELGLRFVLNSAAKTRPNLGHFHLTSQSATDQQDIVAKALDLGARHLAFGQTPEDGHIVMADPGGNEFCVLEPGNNFLADCGFLGELACDGSRQVGLFWRDALNWPLVWDLGQETAVQPPDGEFKISWGGEPAAPPSVRRTHRFFLVTDDNPEAEADRLVALGATRSRQNEQGNLLLDDPDGNEFELAGQEPA